MTTALLRKARADLAGRPIQTALIFLVVAVASLSLALAMTIQHTAASAFDRYFAKANGAHAWFEGASDPSDLERIGGLPGVVGTAGPYPAVGARPLTFSSSDVSIDVSDDAEALELATLANGDAEPVPLELVGMPDALPDVARPVVMDGRWITSGATSEVVLDLGTADALGVRVGDEVAILAESVRHIVRVVGLAVSPGRPPYPRTEPALVYTLLAGLPRFQPDMETWRWRYGVRTESPGDVTAFIAEARNAYPSGQSIVARSWISVRDDFQLSTLPYVLPLTLGGVIVVVAVGFAVVNAIVGNVLSHVRDIGILKALGFSPRAVTGLVLLEHAGLGLVAALAGALIGVAAAPLVLPRLITQDVPVTVKDTAVNWPYVAAIVFGVVLLIALMAYLPAWRAGRIQAVHAIRGGVFRSRDRASRTARFASWAGVPPVAVLGLKDTFNRPVRSMLSVLSLIAAVVMATFSLGMHATISAAAEDPTVLGGTPWDVRLNGRSSAESDGELRQLIESRPEVDGYSTELSVTLRRPDAEGVDVPSVAVSSETQRFRYFIPEGRMFDDPGEAIITQRAAEDLGVEVGDEVELKVSTPSSGLPESELTARRFVLRIVGRYASVSDDGRGLVFGLETLRRYVSQDVSPDSYGVKLRRDADLEGFKAAIVAGASGPVEFFTLESELGDEVGPVLFGVTAALLLLASLNIFVTALFAVRERSRDFGILKAVGVTPEQILAAVLAGGALLAAASVLIGVPLGLLMTRTLFDVFGEQEGFGTGLFRMPNASLVAASAPVALLFAVLGLLLPAWRASRTRVVEVLSRE